MTSSMFFGYDLDNLKVLLNFRINELMKKRLKFREDWIINKRCSCVNNLMEGITINCTHYNVAAKEYLKEDEKKIKKLGSFILKADLYNNHQFPNQWLHRIKV